MGSRKPLSKKIRFEVFKRDKFTCQYCGQKSPEVILHVDHIEPVAGGGGNDIINLITSCIDCNGGKSDRKLDDNSVVEKQRKQIEILQEKREQIGLMVEWKKSLAALDTELKEIIVEYINDKIKPFVLNENGHQSVLDWLKKFPIESILDGVDEAAKKYLKYTNGELQKASVEVFLDKIVGVMVYKGMPPIKQKLAYIKGIGRNRFDYWDDKKSAILLNNYVKALKDSGYDDVSVENDLETSVIPHTKEANSWSVWERTINGWIIDISKWDKTKSKDERRREFYEGTVITVEQLESFAYHEQCSAIDIIEALIYIGKIFPKFNEVKFKEEVFMNISSFITSLEKLYEQNPEKELEEDKNYIDQFVQNSMLIEYFDIPDLVPEYGMLLTLKDKSEELIGDLFHSYYLPKSLLKRKDTDVMLKLHKGYIENQIATFI